VRKKLQAPPPPADKPGTEVAAAGPGSSAGGDTQQSTPEQIRAAADIHGLRMMGLFLNQDGIWPFKDPRAQAIAAKILSVVGTRKLKDGAYRLEEQCSDSHGNSRAGGAVVGDVAKPICLSLSELKKVPPHQLPAQIVPLLGHELAHQAGYGEEDARFFQEQLLKRTIHFDHKSSVFILIENTLDLIADASKLLEAQAPLEQACALVGTIRGHLLGLQRLSGAFAGPLSYEPSAEDADGLMLTAELWTLELADTRSFCGLESRNTLLIFGERTNTTLRITPIAKGDFKAMSESLKTLDGKLRDFVSKLDMPRLPDQEPGA
jgi:hypothetical protein